MARIFPEMLIPLMIANALADKPLTVYSEGLNVRNWPYVEDYCKELGKSESLITHVGDCKGHDMSYAIDPTKIHNELGWLPETKFEDRLSGISITVSGGRSSIAASIKNTTRKCTVTS